MSSEPRSPAATAPSLRSQLLGRPPSGGVPALRGPGGLLPIPGAPPPGVPEFVSSYIEFLPGIYRDDPFLGRFLLIFEHVLGPIDRTVGNIPWYFDPGLTPAEFLPWLAEWVGLMLDERWPEASRRAVVAGAAELFRWRGTRRGMRAFLKLYVDVEPGIIEPTARQVAADRGQAFRFTVRITLPPGRRVDSTLVEDIIDLEKPAWAAYSLEVITS